MYNSDGSRTRPKLKTKLEIEDCGLNHFRGFDNKTLLDMYGIPEMKCLKASNNSAAVEGDFYSEKFKYY